MASLMDQARAQRSQPQDSGALKVPDYRQFTPPEILDDVERIVAAGAKLMYSPELREELHQTVNADMPIDQKLGDSVVGLLLTMDQQAKGGLPAAAIFPAGMGLLGEAAQVLQAAGQKVTQEDFNDAALRMFTIIGKKLGGTDEQIMSAAQQAMGGQPGMPPDAAVPAGQPPERPPGQPPSAGGALEPGEVDEEAAMAWGMQ